MNGAQVSCSSREGALIELKPKNMACESESDSFPLSGDYQLLIGIYEKMLN